VVHPRARRRTRTARDASAVVCVKVSAESSVGIDREPLPGPHTCTIGHCVLGADNAYYVSLDHREASLC
jgi:hypothetical protein